MQSRRQQERALVRSIRSSPIASIVTDPRAHDNPIVAANQPFEELTGYREDELIGVNCRILAGPNTAPERSAALAEAIAAATPTMVELLNYRKDGSTFMNAVMIVPVFDDLGELAYFVGSQMEVDRTRPNRGKMKALERVKGLTPQQQAVLRLMAQGLRNRQIGEELGLSEKTIKMYRSALFRRLDVSTASEAIRLAIEAGF